MENKIISKVLTNTSYISSKDNKVSNIKNNGQNDDEEAKCKLNINSDYERTNSHGKSPSDLNKKIHALNENKKEDRDCHKCGPGEGIVKKIII